MTRQSLYLLLLLLMVGPSWASTLELRNGDRLSGEFMRADETHIYWASSKFGTLRVDKADVADIATTKPLKIHGVRTPCLIEGMDDEHLLYICGGDAEPRRVPLVSIAVIAPYKNFIQGVYSYKGRINLSGIYARGNDVRDDWVLTSNVEYRRHDWRHTARVEYASYSRQRRSSDVKWGGRYGLDWFFRERWFLNNEIRYGADELRALDRYYNFSSGAGFQFWENPTTALSLTGGLAYVGEVYREPDQPPEDFNRREERTAWRVGSDFRYRLPMNVSLFHKSEMVLATESGGDWQLTSSTGVSTMIAARLYSEVKIDYNVDNRPQQNTRREDTRLQIGLNYEW
ncbi:DUF481 domain-containing protein [Marinimicrobium sp. ABcell2]|uniref:DUF481 domain-containing protein n=1 Tax=Marinimicrobium sp. ABcell2 TaxID=3069751 RepID=UPI0027B70B54|nr:DUF481 domain-containing protein [Marinimicrobium sp. ABcell2]MDQ2078295.1 DUF481 domain-containing protein [Marinimicrobium sp. ABcell2]